MAVNGPSKTPSIGSTPPPSGAVTKPDTQPKAQTQPQPQAGSAAPGKKDEFVQPQKKDPVDLSGGSKGPGASVRAAAASGNKMAEELVKQADKVMKEIIQAAMGAG